MQTFDETSEEETIVILVDNNEEMQNNLIPEMKKETMNKSRVKRMSSNNHFLAGHIKYKNHIFQT